jgi:hypothetical protein
MGTALVHEHEVLGFELPGHQHSPGCPQKLITLCGYSSPLYLGFGRTMRPQRARQTAAPLVRGETAKKLGSSRPSS